MKREHIFDKGDLPPFYEDLVFYAPLTEGDLSDHISGNTMSVLSPGGVAWDGNMGMYLFNGAAPARTFKTLFSWNGLDLDLQTTVTASVLHHTIHHKLTFVSSGIYHRAYPTFSYVRGTNQYAYICLYAKSYYNYNFIDNELYSITEVIDGSTTNLYVNGIRTASVSTILNGNMSYSQLGTTFNIYPLHQGDTAQGGISYNRDIRVYNRVMSDSEVAQL